MIENIKFDHEMHSSKKGNQWYFGTNARIEVGSESGLIRNMHGTSGDINNIATAEPLLYGQESVAFGDAGYQNVDKRAFATKLVAWHAAMRPDKRHAFHNENVADPMIDEAAAQGAHRGQSGAPVSFDQSPIQVCEGALPRAQE